MKKTLVPARHPISFPTPTGPVPLEDRVVGSGEWVVGESDPSHSAGSLSSDLGDGGALCSGRWRVTGRQSAGSRVAGCAGLRSPTELIA